METFICRPGRTSENCRCIYMQIKVIEVKRYSTGQPSAAVVESGEIFLPQGIFLSWGVWKVWDSTGVPQ